MPKTHKSVAPTQTEAKFRWGATAAAVYAAIVAWCYNNPHAFDAYLPTWARTLILAVIGVGGIGKAIHQAPHTYRTDVAGPDGNTMVVRVTDGGTGGAPTLTGKLAADGWVGKGAVDLLNRDELDAEAAAFKAEGH
jgi:hypothetical protein